MLSSQKRQELINSMAGADCRTRSHAYSQKSSRKGSGGTTSSTYLDSSPVRIFEHRRNPTCVDLEKQVVTEVSSPESFRETEQWLVDVMRSARTELPEKDESSTAAILFVDEKKCAKVFNEEFPVNKLQALLKINDWVPSHYMSVFYRFPVPVDIDDEDEPEVEKLWDWRYTISHPFDWDKLWVYFPATRTSVGIVRTWFDGYDTGFLDLESLVMAFSGPTMAHPMFLGLMSLQILTNDSMMNVREKGNRLYEAQKRTGFHTYNRLRVTEVDGDNDDCCGQDLTSVTSEILGAASNLTGWENASEQLLEYADFLKAENERFKTSRYYAGTGEAKRLGRYIDQQADKLKGDIHGALRDIRAWLSTAQFILQGVLNLVSQHDANVNIELAKDSKRIALESKRDSTSMTAIAVVTMFFLPGTFTAVSSDPCCPCSQ
jgi:hypothetical protein